MSDHIDKTPFEYEGFSNPNGTIVPDEVFDVLMPQLTDAELRILLYIIRRTFGFKKNSDEISLRQMVDGIITRDGRVLDRGTGLSKPTVARGLVGLRDKKIIVATRNRSAERGNEATTYRLRFKVDAEATAAPEADPRENVGRSPLSHQRDKGLSQQQDRPLSQQQDRPLSHQRDKPLSHQRDTQQTVKQQTVKQQTEEHFSKNSKGIQPKVDFVDNLWISASLPYSAREKGDANSANSSTPPRRRGDFDGKSIEPMADPPEPPIMGGAKKLTRQKCSPTLPPLPPEEYEQLVRLMRDWSVEMEDRQHVGSNTTHALNIMLHAKWPFETFYMYGIEARKELNHTTGVRNRMAFWFSKVREYAGLGKEQTELTVAD